MVYGCSLHLPACAQTHSFYMPSMCKHMWCFYFTDVYESWCVYISLPYLILINTVISRDIKDTIRYSSTSDDIKEQYKNTFIDFNFMDASWLNSC